MSNDSANGHSAIHIQDVTPSGQPGKTFILNSTENGISSSSSRVFDAKPTKSRDLLSTVAPIALLKDVFLPIGWPASVSSDYTRYQIFDSLQAFSSTIASLLSSRAVLTGIGVGDSAATASSAILLHILQDASSRLATIIFAHRIGCALEPETKRYRLLADIFNDIAIVLDCASPLLPRGIFRVGVLAAAGVLRALCGVAAGATKAALSVHFAAGGDGSGNVGELNAKDASQETVISLLGSLVGGLVVSWITGPLATWAILLILLAVHLMMNLFAVRAVRMRTLNRQRAGMVFMELLHGRGECSPEQIGAAERIFEHDGVVRNQEGKVMGYAKVGIGIEAIGQQLPSSQHIQEQSKSLVSEKQRIFNNGQTETTFNRDPLTALCQLFRNSNYILYPDLSQKTILIAFADAIQPVQQLQAWAQAMLLLEHLWKTQTQRATTAKKRRVTTAEKRRTLLPDDEIRAIIEQTQRSVQGPTWERYLDILRRQGWDLDTPSLETRAGMRYTLSKSTDV